MTFEQIISYLTVVSTFAVKLIGFPSQIRKVRKVGHIDGVSILYFFLAFVAYVLWTVHGILKNDYTIIVGQSLGVIGTGILLIVLFKMAVKKSMSQHKLYKKPVIRN